MDFLKSMRAEHMSRVGNDFTFVSSNYKVRTQARNEWLYVVGDENGNQVDPPASDTEHGRVIRPIDELLQNPLAKEAKLVREEMIAIVMYTGPAFVLYNAVLRQFPAEIYQVFKDGNNLFPTTIFVLVSAINKLSRCMNIPPGTLLYRGLGGTLEFPDSFSRADPKRTTPIVLGFLEYGFMSTSADKSVAVQYSGVKEGMPKACIMQIHPNAVDRGADISKFSQYPGEKEFLFVPYSFIQGEGRQRTEVVDGGGVLTIVPVRVNINLKTETVQELKEKKKRLHLASAIAIVEELRYELEQWSSSAPAAARRELDPSRQEQGGPFTTATLAAAVIRQCEAVVKRQAETAVEEYVDDGVFRALVSEMLDTKAWAKEKIQLWMRNSLQHICFLQRYSLRQCHRWWQSFLRQSINITKVRSPERAADCVELLKSRGFVKRGVLGEVNADGEDLMVQAGGDGWGSVYIEASVVAGANVGSTDGEGCNGVYHAAKYGHSESMSALLAAGCDANACMKGDISPIYTAAGNGHASCIKLLISHRGEVNKCTVEGISPIFIASQQGFAACITELVSARGDVNKCRNDGTSAIFAAAVQGNSECIALLASLRGDVNKCNKDGVSPIQIAAQHGHATCIAQIVSCGGNVDAFLSDGRSSIYMAAQNGHVCCIKELVSRGADLNKCRNDGFSTIHIAAQEGHAACVAQLILFACDVNKCTNDGCSPITVAANKGHTACITHLISAKGNVNICNSKGSSPILIAAQSGHAALIAQLASYRGDVNKCKHDGASPIFMAAQIGHADCIAQLVSFAGDVSKCNNSGVSPICIAAVRGHAPCVAQLLSSRADPRSSWNGNSAADFSRQEGHTECVRLLEAALK